MRRIAASLVCPVSSPPIKNAVITLDRTGLIVSVEAGSDRFREKAGVEFYSGILIPGMVDVFCGERESSWLMTRGVRLAGRIGAPRDIPGASGDDHLQPFRKGRQGIIEYRIYDDTCHFQNIFQAGKTDGIYHALEMEGLPVLGSSGKMEMAELLLRLQEGEAGASLPLLFAMATLNGARALGNTVAGCLQPGMQPGLNIIEGADIRNMRLLPGSRLRRLC